MFKKQIHLPKKNGLVFIFGQLFGRRSHKMPRKQRCLLNEIKKNNGPISRLTKPTSNGVTSKTNERQQSKSPLLNK
jgi:hypothetical protein